MTARAVVQAHATNKEAETKAVPATARTSEIRNPLLKCVRRPDCTRYRNTPINPDAIATAVISTNFLSDPDSYRPAGKILYRRLPASSKLTSRVTNVFRWGVSGNIGTDLGFPGLVLLEIRSLRASFYGF